MTVLTDKEYAYIDYAMTMKSATWAKRSNEEKAEILAGIGKYYPGLGVAPKRESAMPVKKPGIYKEVFKGTPDQIDKQYFPWLKSMKQDYPKYKEISKKETIDTHSFWGYEHILVVVYSV